MSICRNHNRSLKRLVLFAALFSDAARAFTRHPQRTPVPRPWVCLASLSQEDRLESSSSTSRTNNIPESVPENIPVPDSFETPVLQSLVPLLLQHNETYGNPNIPLGSLPGRQCEQLRRLHIQKKLAPHEEEWLNAIGFRFYSLEQVYETANFDQLYQRLLHYAETHDGDLSPPKKYPSNPELGAWVTGIRRKGPEHVLKRHKELLDQVQFAWTSPRQCGSEFMKTYRALCQAVQEEEESANAVWDNPQHQKWIRAQQVAAQKGTLSATRQHYIQELLQTDEQWVTRERPWEKR